MLKNRYRQWFACFLPGIVLLVVLFINGGSWLRSLPIAQANGPAPSSSDNGCTTTFQGPNFGETIVIGQNDVACGKLMDFGGKVAIDGKMQGDVSAFGSTMVVTGTVDGDIHLYGGLLTLQSGSQVHGDINLYGGRLIHESGSQFDGNVYTQNDQFVSFIGSEHFSFPLWSIVIWVALGLLLSKLLPEHVTFVRTTVIQKMRRSLLIGLLSILLAPAILIVLTALILPIPVAIIVALGLIAAWALGTVAVGWIVGEHIVRAVAPQRNTRLVQVVVGLAALALVGAIPYIGWLISLATGLVGLGAVFLSRFGTRLYSQPKRPIIE